MTIVLDEKLSEQVQIRAQAQGQDPSLYVNAVLSRALWGGEISREYSPDSLSLEEDAESHASIRRGLEDVQAGRGVSLKDWAATVRHEYNLPTHLSDAELFGTEK